MIDWINTSKSGITPGFCPKFISFRSDNGTQEIRDQSPWCMLFADDIVICSIDKDIVEEKLEQWRKELEDRGLKISRGKTEYLKFNEDQDTEICLE